MNIAIDRERLAATFIRLCQTDSPSRHEGRIAALLCDIFAGLGADSIETDGSAVNTGSETGNLIVRFNGADHSREPLFFCCHMDTVEPGVGVGVVRTGDRFTSRGDTVLGSDDKSGIAALLEMIAMLRQEKVQHGPIELIFTTCEEIGLLGAKHLDIGLLKARQGYALDTTGIDRVITHAPASNRLKIVLHGIAAHAGLNPEDGVSSFQMAAKAIEKLRLGRLDEDSTANLGLIHGGVATNIVPALLTIEGEVRSHSAEKLSAHTRTLIETFEKVVGAWPVPAEAQGKRPRIEIETTSDYPAMALPEDAPVLARIRHAGRSAGRKLEFLKAGGGSDANILNGYGLSTAIVATGMNNVHSTEEYVDLDDMAGLTELLRAIVLAS